MGDHFRVYAPDEAGSDGYPLAWHSIDGGPGVKHLAREAAGHRCVRCLHPYPQGAGEWSRCEPTTCRHGGPVRWLDPDGDWVEFDLGTTPLCSTTPDGDRRTVEAQWRILTVHHLRQGREAKRDLRWWNLAPLCQRCHLQVQRKVHMERVYPWPHTEWFRPYVAGWYAWAYLGEELTREQAEARVDELLALEAAA
jgi:hypothetical protein